MRYRVLNLLSTVGIIVSFIIIAFVNVDTIRLTFIAILCICFVILIANVILNKNESHLDGLLFFNLRTNKKDIDEDSDFDD